LVASFLCELIFALSTSYRSTPAKEALFSNLYPTKTYGLSSCHSYPTLLRLAGGSLGQSLPLDGKDAWATIAEGKPSPHEEILLNVTPYNGALRQGHWKVVHNGNLTANYTGGPPTVDTYELFNLSEDPFEKNDLSRTNPEKLRELQHRLRSYAAEAVPANIPPSRMPEGFTIPSAWGHPD